MIIPAFIFYNIFDNSSIYYFFLTLTQHVVYNSIMYELNSEGWFWLKNKNMVTIALNL